MVAIDNIVIYQDLIEIPSYLYDSSEIDQAQMFAVCDNCQNVCMVGGQCGEVCVVNQCTTQGECQQDCSQCSTTSMCSQSCNEGCSQSCSESCNQGCSESCCQQGLCEEQVCTTGEVCGTQECGESCGECGTCEVNACQSGLCGTGPCGQSCGEVQHVPQDILLQVGARGNTSLEIQAISDYATTFKFYQVENGTRVLKATYNETNESYHVYNNLKPNTSYTFYVEASNQYGSSSGSITDKTTYSVFAWDTEKKAGDKVLVTASEWRRLQDFIDSLLAIEGKSFTWNRVSAGNTITANAYNQVVDALSLIAPSYNLPSKVASYSSTLTALSLNQLVICANSIY